MSGSSAPRGVLLTGATGFLGKVVLCELLRRREELGFDRIFLAVRAGSPEQARERLAREIAASPALADFSAEVDRWVEAFACDLARPEGGMSRQDRERLLGRVTRVINCAASIDFTLPIAQAAVANISTALNVLALAQELNAPMVSVSTAYVTPHRGDGVQRVEEDLVPLGRDVERLHAELMRPDCDETAVLAEHGHPNTYTLTKCIAEHLLEGRRGELSLTVVRPSIISASRSFPMPGWIDSSAAFAGFVALVGTGRLRAVQVDLNSTLDLIAVDDVAERVIDAARIGDECIAGFRILHATAGNERSACLEDLKNHVVRFFRDNPVMGGPRLGWLGTSSARFRFEAWRRQRLPLTLRARYLEVRGKRGRARKVRRLIDRLQILGDTFPYFTHNSFDFRSSRPLAEDFDPLAYADQVCAGVYRHLLKQDPA